MTSSDERSAVETSARNQLNVATHTEIIRTVAPTARELREAFSRYPTGVVAVCADIDGTPTAMVATSFSVGISFDPPLAALAVQNSSTTWPSLRTADVLGISVLAQDQAEACLQLSSRTRDRFSGLELARCELDCALLVEGASMWLEGRIHDEVAAGDHTLVLIELRALKVHEARSPLVYHAMGFHAIAS